MRLNMMWRWLLAAKLFLCEIICLSPAVAVIYTYTKKYVLINIITRAGTGLGSSSKARA